MVKIFLLHGSFQKIFNPSHEFNQKIDPVLTQAREIILESAIHGFVPVLMSIIGGFAFGCQFHNRSRNVLGIFNFFRKSLFFQFFQILWDRAFGNTWRCLLPTAVYIEFTPIAPPWSGSGLITRGSQRSLPLLTCSAAQTALPKLIRLNLMCPRIRINGLVKSSD